MDPSKVAALKLKVINDNLKHVSYVSVTNNYRGRLNQLKAFPNASVVYSALPSGDATGSNAFPLLAQQVQQYLTPAETNDFIQGLRKYHPVGPFLLNRDWDTFVLRFRPTEFNSSVDSEATLLSMAVKFLVAQNGPRDIWNTLFANGQGVAPPPPVAPEPEEPDLIDLDPGEEPDLIQFGDMVPEPANLQPEVPAHNFHEVAAQARDIANQVVQHRILTEQEDKIREERQKASLQKIDRKLKEKLVELNREKQALVDNVRDPKNYIHPNTSSQPRPRAPKANSPDQNDLSNRMYAAEQDRTVREKQKSDAAFRQKHGVSPKKKLSAHDDVTPVAGFQTPRNQRSGTEQQYHDNLLESISKYKQTKNRNLQEDYTPKSGTGVGGRKRTLVHQILKGEIGAGNDNPLLKKALHSLANKKRSASNVRLMI